MPAPSSLLAERHRRTRDHLAALGLDALIVTHPPNIFYLSNHAGTAGILILGREAVHLLADFRYAEALRSLQASPAACPELQIHDVPASYEEALVRLLGGTGLRRIGFEATHVTVARHDWLQRALAARRLDVEMTAVEGVIESARVVKDAYEQQVLRDAASRLSGVAEAAFAAVAPGRPEREVAAAIEGALRGAGFDRPAFDTIVASGPHSARPHHRAGDRRLEPGDLVVLDFGGVLDGYCCDLTRTVSVGPPAPELRNMHGAVEAAQQAAIAAVRPGAAASDVDAAARTVLESRGFGHAFGHGTGHGLGLEVHEGPRVGKPRPDVAPEALMAGMVFTIEPGVYIPGFGGVRIEDDVLVLADGCELLTSVPRGLRTCAG